MHRSLRYRPRCCCSTRPADFDMWLARIDARPRTWAPCAACPDAPSIAPGWPRPHLARPLRNPHSPHPALL